MVNHPNRSTGPSFFNDETTPGYTSDGLRALNKARFIIIEEHGYDMDCLPETIVAEINQSIRDRLTNTHGKNLSVRMLLSLANA